MLTNYLKIAYRNLLKSKVFSFINIFGLSVGIACCVLLGLYIKDEFSYEQHFDGHEKVYRLYTTFTKDGNPETFARVSPPIATALPGLVPEIEIATRVISPPEVEQHLIKYGDQSYYEKLGFLVDSTFFDVFNYEFEEGDARTALDNPASVVLSHNTAMKIFGNVSPIDESLIINSGPSIDTFRVTGVLKPYGNPSHLDAGFYMSLRSEGWGDYILGQTTWAWQNFVSGYVKLKPNTSVAAVDAKMPQLIDLYAGEDLKNAGLIKEIHFQALDDIRLYSNFSDPFNFGKPAGSITYVYILSSIGVFILLLACINFMNLTTAKASQRAGEVGVRKSLGASRKNLIRQFLGESMAIVAISMLVAIVLIQLALPYFNQLTQKQLAITLSNAGFLIGSVVGIALITGLLAGSYPAFFLSAFQPAVALKDKHLTGSAQWLRKGLVVFQFIISITLVSSIVIIQDQLNFIQSKPLGFDPEQNVVIPMRTSEARSEYTQLKNRFRQIAGVTEVSATTSLPSTPLLRDYALYTEGSSAEKGILHRMVHTDEHYFDLMGMKLLAGRGFIYETDSFSNNNPVIKSIVNETSLKELNIPLEEAVGTRLLSQFLDQNVYHEIIGVVEDFHQFSLHEPITPLMFKIPARTSDYVFITIKTNGGSYENLKTQLAAAWKELVPATPFESQFLTESLASQYAADRRVSAIITVFTFLAIVISCMGLYGLSIFVAERKVKEIGIRKVLGATVPGIVAMLSKDFLKLILIAFVIAVPIGYYTMDKWLLGFAYRIDLSIAVFIISGVISFLIAWLTIGFESVRAALGNPVKSLRNE